MRACKRIHLRCAAVDIAISSLPAPSACSLQLALASATWNISHALAGWRLGRNRKLPCIQSRVRPLKHQLLILVQGKYKCRRLAARRSFSKALQPLQTALPLLTAALLLQPATAILLPIPRASALARPHHSDQRCSAACPSYASDGVVADPERLDLLAPSASPPALGRFFPDSTASGPCPGSTFTTGLLPPLSCSAPRSSSCCC